MAAVSLACALASVPVVVAPASARPSAAPTGATAAGPAAAPAAGAALPGGLDPLRLRDDSDGGSDGRRGARAPADGATAVRSATVPLGARPLLRGWRTDGFRQVGATWRGGEPVLSVRTRAARGRWSRWHRLEAMHDGPGGSAVEGRAGLHATDLWWAGEARDLQLRVRGRGHRDLRVVVIDPGGATTLSGAPAAARTTPASRSGVRTVALRTAAAPTHAPRPGLLSRRAWGADESWRTSAPRYNRRLEQVHVHHTVNSNAYSRADVAPMIRGMYRYHTRTLGWSDIGYNFLVDRFGRAWVGRAGGPGRHVRGAHTLGFNENGTGVAVIGNFEQRRAPRPARWTVATLAAWKLDRAGKPPGGSVRVWSHGSDRYPRNSRPRLPRVAGHRDTNETACPGRFLYADLAGIRRAAQRRAARFS